MRQAFLGALAIVSIFIGCSSSDDDTGSTSAGGSGGTQSGGSAGTASGGSGGTQSGGSAGTLSGGSAGTASGGSAGASSGCPSDPTNAGGTPCSEEGKVCGECSDPCQFCNLLKCETGVWTQMEVFPAPCDGG